MCALKNAARLLVDRHGQVQREAAEEEKHLSRVRKPESLRGEKGRKQEKTREKPEQSQEKTGEKEEKTGENRKKGGERRRKEEKRGVMFVVEEGQEHG